MARSTSEHTHALRTLRPLVEGLGFAHLVYLLAELADEQHAAAVSLDHAREAKRALHDARVLGEAAKQLLS